MYNRLRITVQSNLLPAKPGHRISVEANPSQGNLDELFHRVVNLEDQKAFESILSKTYTGLCHFSSRIVHSRELAEEIVEDVFFQIWKNRSRIKIINSFSVYLLVSVRNRSLDWLRKMKHNRNSVLDGSIHSTPDPATADEGIQYQELSGQIELAVQSLPSQCRLIFLMSRNEELTYKEIAARLNISIKTVDTQMGRALKHLRSSLKQVI